MNNRQEAKGTPRMTVKECTMVTPVCKTQRATCTDWCIKTEVSGKKVRMNRLSYVFMYSISLKGCWRVWEELAASTWKTKQIENRVLGNPRKTKSCTKKETKLQFTTWLSNEQYLHCQNNINAEECQHSKTMI